MAAAKGVLRLDGRAAGLTDEQQACVKPLAPNSCVSSANITCDFQSPIHTDSTDVYNIEHPFMSGLPWFPYGTLVSIIILGEIEPDNVAIRCS